jgi:hypothetical protein
MSFYILDLWVNLERGQKDALAQKVACSVSPLNTMHELLVHIPSKRGVWLVEQLVGYMKYLTFYASRTSGMLLLVKGEEIVEGLLPCFTALEMEISIF